MKQTAATAIALSLVVSLTAASPATSQVGPAEDLLDSQTIGSYVTRLVDDAFLERLDYGIVDLYFTAMTNLPDGYALDSSFLVAGELRLQPRLPGADVYEVILRDGITKDQALAHAREDVEWVLPGAETFEPILDDGLTFEQARVQARLAESRAEEMLAHVFEMRSELLRVVVSMEQNRDTVALLQLEQMARGVFVGCESTSSAPNCPYDEVARSTAGTEPGLVSVVSALTDPGFDYCANQLVSDISACYFNYLACLKRGENNNIRDYEYRCGIFREVCESIAWERYSSCQLRNGPR